MVFTQDRRVAPSPQRQTGAPGAEATTANFTGDDFVTIAYRG
jgi:hypothetical protein